MSLADRLTALAQAVGQDVKSILTSLSGKEPTIPVGSTSQYLRGDKSWTDLATSVRAVVLTGLSTATSSAVAATDTLLVALGKLQAQINTLSSGKEPTISAGTTSQFWRGDKSWQDVATAVRAVVLTGLSTATSSAVVATDTLLAALGKLQAQVNSLSSNKLDATATATAAAKLSPGATINGVTFTGEANINITDSSKEPSIASGTTAQFWRGDKSWTDFATTVRATVLTGYAVGSNAALAATDTVLAAFGKIQAQLNAKEASVAAGTTAQYRRGDKTWQDLAGAVRSVVLTGLSTATATAITATDSILVALGKAQAQLNGKAASGNNYDITNLNTLATATWGTSGRIYGDFSNASQSSRTFFQSSTIDGTTIVGAIPNGSAGQSGFYSYSSSDADNSARCGITVTSSLASIVSDRTGSASLVPLAFSVNGERARFDTSGNFYVGSTSPSGNPANSGLPGFYIQYSTGYCQARSTTGGWLDLYMRSGSSTMLNFIAGSSSVGNISTSGSTTSYNTTSDPRMKQDIEEIPDAEEIFDAIGWMRWHWRNDPEGAWAHGVVAPQLKAAYPEAVYGEEDAVDEEGNIVAMGVDYSKLVPILGGTLAKTRAKYADLEARIQALEARQ